MAQGLARDRYRLRLYIGGNSARSKAAVSVVKEVCEERLGSRYVLEVIDLHQQLSLASRDHVVAVPTLLKRMPGPSRRIVGRITRERMIEGLDLP
jgi:circadian clock protein KaiB